MFYSVECTTFLCLIHDTSLVVSRIVVNNTCRLVPALPASLIWTLWGPEKNMYSCCIYLGEECNNQDCCNLASYRRDKHHYQRKNNMESLEIVIFVSLWTKSRSSRLTNTIRFPCEVLTLLVRAQRLHCKMERSIPVLFILHV